jgi:hypothetical protein
MSYGTANTKKLWDSGFLHNANLQLQHLINKKIHKFNK